MKAATIFGGGVPTAPDVDRLAAHFNVPAIGTVIRYDEIAKVIGTGVGESRFKTVFGAWRKRLDGQHNIFLRAVPNVGYEVLNSKQCVVVSASKFKTGLRRIRKSADMAIRINKAELGAEEQRVCDQHRSDRLRATTGRRDGGTRTTAHLYSENNRLNFFPMAKSKSNILPLPDLTGEGVAPLSIPEIDKAIRKYETKKDARCQDRPARLKRSAN